MFRLSHYLREVRQPETISPARTPRGPVVIWNLVRRCNLTCKHCYSISGNVDFPGELRTAEVLRVMRDLKAAHVPALILSGGEPLLRMDIFEISEAAKELGFYLALSTNGTLIDGPMADRIAATGYDYVGISLDGIGATHDRFRRSDGAFDAALAGLRNLRDRNVKVGVRFTMTKDNHAELGPLIDLVEEERFGKFYLSHLVYAGRGDKNRLDDTSLQMSRNAMDLVIERAWAAIEAGRDLDVVTGNNDSDAVYLLHWVGRRFPDRMDGLRESLVAWGGNASGVNVANIDNLGHVHPDTFWWHHDLGNVKDRAFGDIWNDRSDPVMDGLKSRPRPVRGRCGSCVFLNVCGGNTRVRALKLTGDPWAEDPACYLTADELGLPREEHRLAVAPFTGRKHHAAA